MNPTRGRSSAACRRRPGMTLVELLVVTGLIAVFLGLVVTGVRGSRQAQKRGGETLAAVLASAQSRALGVPQGAAAILAPDATPPAACTSLYDAVALPFIEAVVSGAIPPDPASATTATVTVTSMNGEDVQRGYKILLYGGPDCPATSPPTSWLAFTPPCTVQFRATLGQTPNNSVWPKAPAGGVFNATLAQYPAKSSALVQLEEGSAVDLSFSGIGDDRSTAYGRLDGKGAIAVVFDRIGRVAEVIQQVPEPGQPASPGAAQPAIPVGTIYFLVAPRELIVSGANTLASDQATWVALEPQTGRIFVADNVVQTGTDMAALRAARAKARQGVGSGR